MIDQGADVITCHVDSPKVVVETAERRGIYVCGYHANQAALAPKGYLTGAEWNWIAPYSTHVKDALAGKPMVNFLRGGLKEGFVKTSAYGKAVAEGARKNADAVKAQMVKGDFMSWRAGSRSCWAASGSRSLISSVESLMSANRTVTCLRSPSRVL